MARNTDHDLAALHKTNGYGIVAVCRCGWSGNVHPSHVGERVNGSIGVRVYDDANTAAELEHAEHRHAERPLTATLAPEQFVGTVLNTKRFGHA